MKDDEVDRYWTCFKFLSMKDADDNLQNGEKRYFMIPLQTDHVFDPEKKRFNYTFL